MTVDVVISPSSQDANQYAGGASGFGDSEEFWMRRLADRVTVLLRGAGLKVVDLRQQSLAVRVAESNRIRPRVHVAIHSNAFDTRTRGAGTFVAALGGEAERIGRVIQRHLAEVTPTGDLGLRVVPHYETRNTVAPAVILEVEFHDNVAGAEFIRANLGPFAKAIAAGVVEALAGVRPVKKNDVAKVAAEEIEEDEDMAAILQIISAPGRGQALINVSSLPPLTRLGKPSQVDAVAKLIHHKTADLVLVSDGEFDDIIDLVSSAVLPVKGA